MVEEHKKHPGNLYMFLSLTTGGIFAPGSFLHAHEGILLAIGAERIWFRDLRHTFVTTALEYGMDVKTLSAVVGSTTLNVRVTKDMEQQAARIGKQETSPGETQETKHPTMTAFQADTGKRRKPDTGCITQIGNHLWDGRYSPLGSDGKLRSRNVYGHTPQEREEKLKVLIAAMKAEIQKERRQFQEAWNRL